MSAEVISIPTELQILSLQLEACTAELERLREWETTLARPYVEHMHELDRLRAIEERAAVLVDCVRERKQAGWHNVPMREFAPLAEALED